MDLYNIYLNLHELCHYRGFKSEIAAKSGPAFTAEISRNNFVIIEAAREDGRQLLVALLAGDYGTSKTSFVKIFKHLPHKPNTNYLFVVESEPSSHILKHIATLPTETAKYEIYPYAKFAIVVPKHVLVPKHTIISKEEVEKWVASWHTSVDKLQKIRESDSAAVWIGAVAGDVVKIERYSKTSGTSIGLRLCI